MVKVLLLLGILLISIDLYEHLCLRRRLRAEDKIPGGHLFKVHGIRIYRAHFGGLLIVLWLLVR
jgi:hypothetical protein